MSGLWQAVGLVAAGAISAFVAWRVARIGAKSDREALEAKAKADRDAIEAKAKSDLAQAAIERERRLTEMTDALLGATSSEMQDMRSRLATMADGLDEMRQKHQECLDREAEFRMDIRHLKDRVDVLSDAESKAEAQRKMKHDWRSFAGSLLMERETARRFLQEGRVEDATRIMDEADRLRSDNPLLDDLQDLIERDQS